MTKFLIPVVVLATFSASEARDLFEVEPNDTAFTAYDPGFLQHGDNLRGTLTGNPELDLDHWWLRTPNQEPGIYENRFRLTTPGRGFDAAILGLYSNDVVTFTQLADPNRVADIYTRWYTFGRPGAVNYQMNNSSSVPREYVATYEQVRVVPTDLGRFAPGEYRIEEILGNDPLIAIVGLDADYNIVPSLTKAGELGQIAINTQLPPGRYTVGIGFGPISGDQLDPQNIQYSSKRNLGDGVLVNDGQPTFTDDRAPLVNFTAGTLTQTLDWRSEVRSRGTHSLAYYQFEVVPEGDAGIALAVGIGALAMTRRRSS